MPTLKLENFSKLGSVGRSLKGVKVKVIDIETGHSLCDKYGELLVSSKSVTKGYYNDIENTNKIIKNSWLHNGDLAKIDIDGFIYIKGRKKYN